jgi:PAS domain S-box-containing protein
VPRQPIRPPEFSELETFVLAVEERSIAGAARRMRISTQAAAKRLNQLEILAHAPLVSRTRRGVRPTDAGMRLYPVAREALQQRIRVIRALTGEPPPDPRRIAGMHKLIGATPAPPTEELLERTEAIMAAIFHGTSEPIIISRASDGLIHEINDAAVRLTGYDQQTIRGRSAFEVDLWQEPDRRNHHVQEAITSGQPQQATLVIRTRTGEQLPVDVRFEAIDLHDAIHLVTSLREVTTRGAQEQAGV